MSKKKTNNPNQLLNWIKNRFRSNAKNLFLFKNSLNFYQILKNDNIALRVNKLFKKKHVKTNNNTQQTFFLLSGPVYANSVPHLGTAMNHIIKDVIVSMHQMINKKTIFFPGWDVHGMPIIKETETLFPEYKKKERDFLLKCRSVFTKNIELHKNIFHKLSINCNTYYTTAEKDLVVYQLKVLKKLIETKKIYLKFSPIDKCIKCGMIVSISDTKKKNKSVDQLFFLYSTNYDDNFILVWTTTPWTISNNLYLAISNNIKYISIVCVKLNKKIICSWEFYKDNKDKFDQQTLEYIEHNKLLQIKYFDSLNQKWKSIISDLNVQSDKGTGILHLSPFHSITDYNILISHHITNFEYNVLFDHFGRIVWHKLKDIDPKNFFELKQQIIMFLTQQGLLFDYFKKTGERAVCYRCDSMLVSLYSRNCFLPVIKFKKDILKTLKNISLIPKKHNTFVSILQSRETDWCISRERTWGVPLCLFYCKNCRKNFFSVKFLEEFISLIENKNIDYLDFIINFKNISNHCQKIKCIFCNNEREVIPEKLVMDVWFDSASAFSFFSHKKKENIDLIVEGNDQYRGWFQHILILQTLLNQKSVKKILIHGFVTDQNKNKLSKSKKNSNILKVLEQFHPDVIRFWVCSNNIQKDIMFDVRILQQSKHQLKKILLFTKFIIENLWKTKIDIKEISSYRKWTKLEKLILFKLQKLIKIFYDVANNSLQINNLMSQLLSFIAYINANYLEGIKNFIYTIEGENEYYFYQKKNNISSYQYIFRIILIIVLGILRSVIPLSQYEILEISNLNHFFNEYSSFSNTFNKFDMFLKNFNNNVNLETWHKLQNIKSKIYTKIDEKLKLSYHSKHFIFVLSSDFFQNHNMLLKNDIKIFFNFVNILSIKQYQNLFEHKNMSIEKIISEENWAIYYSKNFKLCVRCNNLNTIQNNLCKKCIKYFKK